MLGVAIAVRLRLGSPIFFRQARPGRDGRPFNLIKFRTMRDAVDTSGRPLEDSDRLEGFGRFLRATSLDELPELLNVVRGEMSLVGPRPMLVEEIPKYGEVYELYKQVRPDMTGLWQVSGRNEATYEERVVLAAYYVRNWSI
jgi:lipopolysaccharide/colanic/teichoic acid biosynthesis glycosyltransferase